MCLGTDEGYGSYNLCHLQRQETKPSFYRAWLGSAEKAGLGSLAGKDFPTA